MNAYRKRIPGIFLTTQWEGYRFAQPVIGAMKGMNASQIFTDWVENIGSFVSQCVSSELREENYIHNQGRNQHLISGGAIFMKFHSMTSSCLFNRGTTFSQTVTYNINVFLPADTKSMVQTHTFCTTLVNKNRQNRTFYNSVGGWITGVKRNFWLHAIYACTE